jgi:hypothetical protein
MDYHIEEIRYGDEPTKSYFIPYRQNNYGLWEMYPQLRGSPCETYEETLEVIKKNHVVRVKTHIVNLPD